MKNTINTVVITSLLFSLCYCHPKNVKIKEQNVWDSLLLVSPTLYNLNPATFKEDPPEFCYHSTTFEHLDEKGVINLMLGKRQVAVVSSFTENLALSQLSDSNLNLIIENKEKIVPQIISTFHYIKEIENAGYLMYGLDYLWSPRNIKRTFTLYSGEGFPPFEPGYVIPDSLKNKYEEVPFFDSRFPAFIKGAPNGDYYPKSNRYILYTTPIKEISSLYGNVILKIQAKKKRGLSLPAYCIANHGDSALTDSFNISYWAPGDKEEYVIPAYIPDEDIKTVFIKAGYQKGKNQGKIVRTYIRNSKTNEVMLLDMKNIHIATLLVDEVSGKIKMNIISGFEADFDVGFVEKLIENKRTEIIPDYHNHPKL